MTHLPPHSSETFNALAREFVKELAEVFPDNDVLVESARAFEDVVAKDPTKPTQIFTSFVGDNVKMIHERDESLLFGVDIPGVDVREMWGSTTDTTKDVIWQYLSTLAMFSTTLGGTSNELMTGIETMASEFADKMAKGNMDLPTMLNEVMQRVQQLDLSSLKNEDIGALTKSLGIDQEQITSMMNSMMGGGGGINPELMSMVTSMMGGSSDAGEQDLLKLLESAKPPQASLASLPKQKKKSSGKKNRKK